jgi:hypothetical protein
MSQETFTPSWAFRGDAYLAEGQYTFDDILKIIDGTYRTYSKLYEAIGPWNAKQNSNNFIYQPPSKDYIMTVLKRPPSSINEHVFYNMVSSAIRFCEKHKGKRQLITPHPSSHHSAHFPEGTFEIEIIKENLPILNKDTSRNFKASSIAKISLVGVDKPIFVENVKDANFKYIIVRPKLGKLGTASAKNWEVLFFKNNFGFNFDHTDSHLNPRYSGII